MDDDDYPNFGNAWSAPPAASWNPALRPDADHLHSHTHSKKASVSSVDDFFARYPGPTPEKSRLPRGDVIEAPAESDGDEEEPESPTQRHNIPGRHDTELGSEFASHGVVASVDLEEEDLSQERTNTDVTAQAAEDDERAVFASRDTTRQREPTSMKSTNASQQELKPREVPVPREDDDKTQQNGVGYEHQGELTEMEEAVDEAPDAPLMMDPATPPEVDDTAYLSSIRAVSEVPAAHLEADTLRGKPLPKASDAHPHIDRSFTTNFTEVPNMDELAVEGANLSSANWPAAGDDKTFGELLENDEIGSPAEETTGRTTIPPTDPWAETVEDDAFGEMLDGTQTPELKHDAGEATTITGETSGGQDLAAAWQAALDDDDLLDESQDLDPSTLFGDDDDDGFLDDDILTSLSGPTQTTEASHSPYTNAFDSQSSRVHGHGHARSVGTPQTGLHDVYSQQPPQRPGLSSAQSFVDKSKGGYQSPYDLPMDVVKRPRQRPRPTTAATSQGAPSPPPRTSSFTSQQPQVTSRPPTAGTSVPGPPQQASDGISSSKSTPKTTPKTDSGFFADLPVTSKARARPTAAHTPQPPAMPTPPLVQNAPQSGLRGLSPAHAQPLLTPTAPPSHTPAARSNNIYAGLRQPEQLPLLPEQPTAPQPARAPSTGSLSSQRHSPNHQQTQSQPQNRFSPAPTSQAPPSTSRYSPAPNSLPSQPKRQPSASAMPPPGVQSAHPFAPRTSSPLAQPNEKQRAQYSPEAVPNFPSSPPKVNGFRSPTRNLSEQTNIALHTSPPPALSFGISSSRLDAQIPPAVTMAARYSTTAAAAPAATPSSKLQHRRQFSRDVVYAAPADERAQDPLERWKGHPIFKWGDSGHIVTSVPRQTPFWTAGHGVPSVKCTPGEVKVRDASAFIPMDERAVKFPGPLAARAKGRKKDVLAWMTGKIEDLEQRAAGASMDFQTDSDIKKRADEKLILWKLVKVFVEHDGSLESKAKVDEEVRAILLPDLAQMSQVADLHSPTSATATAAVDQVDKNVILQLRQALLEGQRERAVWLAEDQKLWGHAMLIASTMGSDVWKKTIQAFVRSHVKSTGSDARSLAALYQVFAGNAEECADELVPPSARSGHQFIDMSGTKTNDPLVGLDQWRETLGMVASNRTPNDAQSLVALGQLLSQYGRAEAAHSCFLFARQVAKHSGADDPDAHFVLLGSNHKGREESLGSDLDSILLTEIYEWASSLSAPSVTVHYLPHLQSFKLIHAQQLAASGLRSQAQAYCDHIATAYTSTTKPSQYYHPTFTQAVSDLSAFLSQTPQSGGQGLLSRGAINKVSSSASTWFTKFVSGEDDRDSNSSGAGIGGEDLGNGPFSRVSGDSPVLSRAGSVVDLYNPISGAGSPFAGAHGFSAASQPLQSSSAPSRYGPTNSSGNRYAPNSAAGGLGIEQQRPTIATAKSYAPGPVQALAMPRTEISRATSDYTVPYVSNSRRGSGQSHESYEPRPSMVDDASLHGYSPPILQPSEPHQFGVGNALNSLNNVGGQIAMPGAGENGSYAPPTSGYEPPSTSYEPPSYQPYGTEPLDEQDNNGASMPKKNNFMDDDDDADLAKRAAAMQKAEADRRTDDAFKKAAEADAARAGGTAGDRKSGGWFGGVGGWFKKDPNAQQQGPVRAKLGEENSFVYDETLKKWVNKKGGAEASAPVAASPPPPRGSPSTANALSSGPPSRMTGGPASMGPPGRTLQSIPSSSPPSRAGTPGVNGPDPPGAPSTAPPSRPPTSMSSASTLDDLLGGPPGPGRKAAGTAKSKKKGGRYVDVMGAK